MSASGATGGPRDSGAPSERHESRATAQAREPGDKPVALVTGGGTGIGAACCRRLAADGFRVAVHYRSSEATAIALAAELPDAFVVRADLAVPAEVDELVARLAESPGRIDVLVNNAGANVNGPAAFMKLEDFDTVAGIASGTWYLTKLVLRRFMLRKKSGRIVNVSSVVGHTGNAGQVPYTMAKAGLDALTKSLAQELAGRAILVNSVAPGFVATDMTATLPDEARDAILSRVPLGRMGTADEVADVVAFLATRGSYVNGSVLHVNGGLYGG
jgi:3-oxoacyl-[acyl-carrier protein] reductase